MGFHCTNKATDHINLSLLMEIQYSRVIILAEER